MFLKKMLTISIWLVFFAISCKSIKPDHTLVKTKSQIEETDQFNDKIIEAMTIMEARTRNPSSTGHQIARESLERISNYDVTISSFKGLTYNDYRHVMIDLEQTVVETPKDIDTWQVSKKDLALIESLLSGYMWGNRLYFRIHKDDDPVELSSTLVHEVNHIANRSECSYYQDIKTQEVDDTLASVEEFRAFYAECLYLNNVSHPNRECGKFAAESLKKYDYDDFDGSRLQPKVKKISDLFQNIPVVNLLVNSAWPDDFNECM